MHTLVDSFDISSRADALVVLLPPAEARIEDFHAQGFVAAIRDRGIPADVVLAEVTYQHVMSKTVVSALLEHVVQPAQTFGYREIWLAGISLGAFNALHYAAANPSHLAGVHLIAPYPGTGDILAEIIAAGGPVAWSRSELCEQGDERDWWRWLCREAHDGNWSTPVYLSTGNDDRFRRGQQMLADLLPAERVRYVPGGHGWPTWQQLWRDWLDHGPLAGRSLYTTITA
jgi:pimeloyl-ACP methyl ester carboxylesterase